VGKTPRWIKNHRKGVQIVSKSGVSRQGGLEWTCPPHLCQILFRRVMQIQWVFVGGVRPWTPLCPQAPIIDSRSVLPMCVHPTFFDLATPLLEVHYRFVMNDCRFRDSPVPAVTRIGRRFRRTWSRHSLTRTQLPKWPSRWEPEAYCCRPPPCRQRWPPGGVLSAESSPAVDWRDSGIVVGRRGLPGSVRRYCSNADSSSTTPACTESLET